MAEVKWIKIMTDIFDDDKILLIDGLPERDGIIVIWFKLLCMAGKQNNGGVFLLNDKIAYTDEMLATIFRRPISTIRLALQTFEQFGMIELINNTITIPNWNKHQSLDAYEKKKERDRLYQQQRRAEQKALAEKSSDKSSDIVVSDKEEEKEEEKKEKKNTKTASPFDEILSEIESEELKQTYRDYIEMRKNIRSPLTVRALRLLINRVNSLETSVDGKCALLETAILNNWKSVYAPKEAQGGKNTPKNAINNKRKTTGASGVENAFWDDLQSMYEEE